ncbi:MAG: Rid family hydrolase [Actinomycetota bacterium]|nr:Rid family hydrolase [Actinomycetota bacterium]
MSRVPSGTPRTPGGHEFFNPESLGPPVGFSHAVLAAPGRVAFLAGQIAHGPPESLAVMGVVEQFAGAALALATALEASGGRREDLMWVQIFVTDVAAYQDALKEIGAAWRDVFGRHYPAMGLFGVIGLFVPEAKVELMGIAVIPS